jgi:hypothetical protein
MKLTAVDQLHLSSLGPHSLLPGQAFEVSDDLGNELVARGLAKAADGKKAEAAPANKAEAAPDNKAERSPLSKATLQPDRAPAKRGRKAKR